MALIDDDGTRFLAESTLRPQTLLSVVKTAEKTLKLLSVGCEHRRCLLRMLPQKLQSVVHSCQHIQRVGIEDERFALDGLHESAQGLLAVSTHAGAYGHGIVALKLVGREKMGPMGVVVIDRDHGLGNSSLHHLHPTARHMDSKEADTRAETGSGGKDCRPHLAIAAGYEECVAKRALVAVGSTVVEEIGENGGIDQDSVFVYTVHANWVFIKGNI